ncbi:MAG: secondary thiamine-phosphate synthase enzyme YjbQ [Actinomycetota bacterium]|nr:secondary thiamine-phosphate synthase enzyme YjbQ [Actinomycetota bacterium]
MEQPLCLNSITVGVTAPRRLAFVDLTDELQRAVSGSGLGDGFCVAFCRHTTCGLLINEWEDGAQEDLLKRLDVLVPDRIYYAHDDLRVRTQNLVDDERANGRAHVLQMIIGGNSQVVPVAGGVPLLGRWQRLFLLELDEPKERTILFQTMGRSARLETSPLPTLERCDLTR